MATKIRLQRNGRKGYAFYSIVIADVRAPRDGKFTEKIGTYNPNTNPATVDLKFDRALYWVEVGAQPTDTVRNILSKEGVYMMKHLRGGVKKGAFDEAAAQAKFEAWKNDKQKGLEAFEAKKAAEKKAAAEARLQAEKKVNEEIAKKVAEKKAAEAAAKAEAEAAQAPADAPAEGTTETPSGSPYSFYIRFSILRQTDFHSTPNDFSSGCKRFFNLRQTISRSININNRFIDRVL